MFCCCRLCPTIFRSALGHLILSLSSPAFCLTRATNGLQKDVHRTQRDQMSDAGYPLRMAKFLEFPRVLSQFKYLMCCLFFLSRSPSLAADNQGAWVGFMNCLAARNLVLNCPFFCRIFSKKTLQFNRKTGNL